MIFISCTNPKQLILAEAGKSDYRIVLSAEGSPSERHAATELQYFLKEISGAELLIATDEDTLTAHEILIGNNRHVQELRVRTNWDGLGGDGFIMRTTGDHLILAGSKSRGSLYAVYNFLEDVLGCRWFAPDGSRIPKQSRIAIKPQNVRQIPELEFRAVGWPPVSDADWAARNKVNAGASLDEEHGGALEVKGGGHSFFALLPPDLYFKEHPEYYAELNGRRTHQKAQLCLSNPDVIRLAGEGVKQWIRESPNTKRVAVGQGDWGGWCECPNCQAIDEREESHSGSLISFLNQIGEIIEKDFPDVAIVSLAYQHTRKPPKSIRPRHNVIPWVCGIECCYSHAIETCELNRSFKEDVHGWAKLTDHFYIWDYTANFEHYIMPHPNLRVLQPNLRFFVKNHVRGVYGSGNTGKGAELGELRGYLLAKLLWNPDYDVEAGTREFLQAYYGKAAAPIAMYLKLMHDKVEADSIHCFINSGPMHGHLQPPMIAKAKELFDEAERLAENAAVLQRIKVARMPIQHVELEWAKPKYRLVDGLYQAELIPGAERLAEEFLQTAERNGVTSICEFENRTPAWHLRQQAFWKKTWPAARLENDDLRIDVVPGLGGRIVSLWQKNKNRELLLPAQPDGREYPWSGGYEEYSQRGGREAGWREAYEFREEVPGKRVRIWSTMPSGLRLERTMELDAYEPLLTIQSGLINTTNAPKIACLRVHPIFRLGPTEQVTASFTSIGGSKHFFALKVPSGRLREKLILKLDERPNGSMQAVNSQLGLSITQEFDVQQVEEFWLDWLPARERFFAELSSPEKTLAPGESIYLTHRYKISETSAAGR